MRLGNGQAASHLALNQVIVGSNPTSPAMIFVRKESAKQKSSKVFMFDMMSPE